MKILVNTPLISSPAGVSNHYLGLKPYFSRDVIYNQYFTINYIKRKIKFTSLSKPLRFLSLLYDYMKFIILIVYYRYPTILLNPSFKYSALTRDLYYLRIAKMFGCKVVVFIHGWDKNYLQTFFDNKNSFNSLWYKADAFFVLAKEFKDYLHKLKITAPIYITTTKVDDVWFESVPNNGGKTEKRNLLFLARIDMAKGIYTTIDTYALLQKKFLNLKLRIVGDGPILKDVKSYVEQKIITNVTFTGPLFGQNLINEFIKGDIYILPTLGEGMPTTVLEAMAFGLPVITRPVGGLIDFFENGKMGVMIESLDPEEYAKSIEELIIDSSKFAAISKYNKDYAKKNFMASKVANYLETTLRKI
jgi:glycosyltransferase involved in cell wall biosynthesis